MVMAKHSYRPTEEESKNVLRMRSGAPLLPTLLGACHGPALPTPCILESTPLIHFLAYAVTSLYEVGAGFAGCALAWNVSGMTALRRYRCATCLSHATS